MENYQLPIDGNWQIADTIIVANLVDKVLMAYESGIEPQQLLTSYQEFCQVMPSKSEQKAFDRDFQKQTGHGIYQTIQVARAYSGKRLKL